MRGGHLVRFQQTFNGVAVENGGIGIVMNANKQVIMASGPFFRDVAVNTQPSLSAEQARTAADNDLNQFYVALPAAATNLLKNGLSILSQQLSAVEIFLRLSPSIQLRMAIVSPGRSPSFRRIHSACIWSLSMQTPVRSLDAKTF